VAIFYDSLNLWLSLLSYGKNTKQKGKTGKNPAEKHHTQSPYTINTFPVKWHPNSITKLAENSSSQRLKQDRIIVGTPQKIAPITAITSINIRCHDIIICHHHHHI